MAQTGVNAMNIAFDQPGAGAAGYGVTSENIMRKMRALWPHRNDKAGGSKQIWDAMVSNTAKSLERAPNSTIAKEFDTFLRTGKTPTEATPQFLEYSIRSLDYGLRETGRATQHKSNFLDSTFGKILHAIGTVALGVIPVVGPYAAALAGGINAASRTRPSGMSIAGGVVGGYTSGLAGQGIASGVGAAGGVGPYLSNLGESASNFIQHPIQTAFGAGANLLDPPLTSVTYTPGSGVAGVAGGAVTGGTGAVAPILSGAGPRAGAAGAAGSTGSAVSRGLSTAGRAANIISAGAAIAGVGAGASMSSKAKSTSTSTRLVDLRSMSAEERALLNQQLDMASSQLENLSRLGTFDANLFNNYLPKITAQINKFLPKEDQITSQSLGFSSDIIGEQSGLLDTAMAQINRGVQLTPDQAALIKSSADNAIAAGTSDIAAFRDDGIRQLVQEQSVARGLRPEDTPIGDVGGRIVKDADRQASELINSVRSQEAQQRLQYPIQAGQYTADLIGRQQQVGSTNQAFINQLRQDAFNNRLNLISTGGQIGTNVASIGPAPSTFASLENTRLGASSISGTGTGSSTQPTDWASIAGGVGGLLAGVGALNGP